MAGRPHSLAIESASRALERAGRRGPEIDLLVLATTTPDQTVPATSSWVHHQLELSRGRVRPERRLRGICLRARHRRRAARRGPRAGAAHRLRHLVPDHRSEDRNTAVLFGDGAGAVVIEADRRRASSFSPMTWASMARSRPILYCDRGGYIYMEGREVFRKAVRATVESAERVLKQADVTAEDIALFVPHQANIRIIDAMGQRLGIDPDRYAICLDHTGQHLGGSCRIALAEAADAGRLNDGDLVLSRALEPA